MWIMQWIQLCFWLFVKGLNWMRESYMYVCMYVYMVSLVSLLSYETRLLFYFLIIFFFFFCSWDIYDIFRTNYWDWWQNYWDIKLIVKRVLDYWYKNVAPKRDIWWWPILHTCFVISWLILCLGFIDNIYGRPLCQLILRVNDFFPIFRMSLSPRYFGFFKVLVSFIYHCAILVGTTCVSFLRGKRERNSK